VSVAYKKVPGVESVEVSLNSGLAHVKLKPGNTAPVERFWQIAKDLGYVVRETRVLVRGEVEAKQGRSYIRVPGIDAPYELGKAAALEKLAGSTVEIEGVITPAKDSRSRPPIVPGAIQPIGPDGVLR
jgi:hypothetical protein